MIWTGLLYMFLCFEDTLVKEKHNLQLGDVIIQKVAAVIILNSTITF